MVLAQTTRLRWALTALAFAVSTVIVALVLFKYQSAPDRVRVLPHSVPYGFPVLVVSSDDAADNMTARIVDHADLERILTQLPNSRLIVPKGQAECLRTQLRDGWKSPVCPTFSVLRESADSQYVRVVRPWQDARYPRVETAWYEARAKSIEPVYYQFSFEPARFMGSLFLSLMANLAALVVIMVSVIVLRGIKNRRKIGLG